MHHLVARFSLLPTDSGGRKSPIPAGQFRTVIGQSDDYFSAAIFPAAPISPGGESVTCPVTFLLPDEALPQFPVGRAFELWEGGVKGHGQVVEICGS